MTARIAVFLLAGLLAGCASSRLTVSVDLYDEDPRIDAPMSPKEAIRLIDDVEQLRAAASEKTGQRKYLATMSRDIFLDTWSQARGNPSVADGITSKHKDYVKDAEDELVKLQTPLDDAVQELQRYIGEYERLFAQEQKKYRDCEKYRLAEGEARNQLTAPADCGPSDESKRVEHLSDEWILRRLAPSLRTSEAMARSAVSRTASAYRGFASPLQSSFVIDWPNVRSSLYVGLVTAQSSGMDIRQAQLEQAIYAFNARMADLATASKLIPKDELAAAVAARAAGSPTGLLDSTLKLAVELESLRSDLPDTARAQTALAGLVRGTTQFIEQIDRLQDNGNPIWRIVTDPANEPHWNTQRVQTAFYAQGKSSVVMVRHDPMRYDIHEGTNNPAALIKGQLEISRAVANAALSIAGTATGLRLPAEAETPTSAADATTASTSAAAFARRKAEADEAERARERTLRGLELALSGIIANLAAAGDNATVLAAQRSRLESVLKAYRIQLEASTN